MARSRGKAGADNSANAAPETESGRKAGNGHPNNIPDPKALAAFLSQIDGIHSEMAEANGAWRSQIKDIYEQMANKLGKPRKVCKAIVKKYRDQLQHEKFLENLEPTERDHYESLEAALGSDYLATPLGQAAQQMETAGTA